MLTKEQKEMLTPEQCGWLKRIMILESAIYDQSQHNEHGSHFYQFECRGYTTSINSSTKSIQSWWNGKYGTPKEELVGDTITNEG